MKFGGTSVAHASNINKVIDIIQNSSKEVLFRAYVMQMLLESFEDVYNIDVRKGFSISKSGDSQNEKQIFLNYVLLDRFN